MKKTILFTLVIMLLLTSGCEELDALQKSRQNLTTDYFNKTCEVKTVIINETVVCGDLDRVGIFLLQDDINAQLKNYVRTADTIMYCEINYIDDERLAKDLVYLHENDVDVKLILDTNETMNCDSNGICLPKQESKYLFLLEKGMRMKLRTNGYENYCINNRSVYLFIRQDTDYRGLFLESNKSAEVYRNEFLRIWSN